MQLTILQMRLPLFISALMLSAFFAAKALTPRVLWASQPVNLEQMIPRSFSDWQMVPDRFIQPQISVNKTGLGEEETKSLDTPYDQVLMRSYFNTQNGAVVMLALAYGRQQGQEIRVHRPEACYPAQGSVVSGLRSLDAGEREGMIPENSRIMFGRSSSRLEQVLYWIRFGDHVVADGFDMRKTIFWAGVRGYVLDGLLVRTSQRIDSEQNSKKSLKIQQDFLSALMQTLPPEQRGFLAPQKPPSKITVAPWGAL